MMTYNEALAFIKSTGKFGSRPGLEVISALLKKMGDPQNNVKCVHIAGTNGKGSTSAYIASVMRQAGYRTGMFTSPPIMDETERIQLDGQYIDKAEFAEITEFVKAAADKVEADGLHYPTEFELFTAVAFEYFSRKNVDIAVLETGMGGRLDATNVCKPIVCIITAMGLDHTQYLGDTIEKIAAEKAGIIKENTPVVLYPEQEPGARAVVKSIAESRGSRLLDVNEAAFNIKRSSIEGNVFDYAMGQNRLDGVTEALIGEHQVRNCATALTALFELKDQGFELSKNDILEGLRKTGWPGRFEIVYKKPLVIFDGGHNEQCMKALVKCVDMYLGDYKKILVFSMFEDKDCQSSARLLHGRFDYRIITQMVHPRRATAEYIAQRFDEEVHIIRDTKEALTTAVEMAKADEAKGIRSMVLVCGSLNLLEEILQG